MIVDCETLDVRPIAERLLASFAGREASDVERGPMGWSNELVRHVVEVKNAQPAARLAPLIPRFHDEVRAADALLAEFGARLMPGAMHPWMDPVHETELWDGEIYATYDRIYDCRTHGWANLQSMHVNLPFAGDSEFARLHAAIRLLVPLLPALAASSPIADGAWRGLLDYRLDAYRNNCTVTPSVGGRVVPETVETQAEYDAKILRPMYDEIARHDTASVLQHEWLNSRGAIARFDRAAIEIRVIDDAEYQHALGISSGRATARDVWASLLDDASANHAWWQPTLDAILREGPLARRILRATGPSPDRGRLRDVYGRLCECLRDGHMFHGRE
jgi:gamma-glutamyl:cysteine ligase YbdK (ATP-grasp superfamily)